MMGGVLDEVRSWPCAVENVYFIGEEDGGMLSCLELDELMRVEADRVWRENRWRRIGPWTVV